MLPSLTPALLLDINPGGADSFPQNFTQVNNLVFFRATDEYGAELWASDGAAGTHLVKDINPGAGSSNPSNLTNVNGTLFFTANDGVHGDQLWRSNGTAAGTVLVRPYDVGAIDPAPSKLTNLNGTVFFSASDPAGFFGQELWRTDPTGSYWVLVADINPGTGSSQPHNLTSVNGTLFFEATDGTHGFELWESNGKAAGTFMVKDINPGTSGSYPGDLTNVNGTLFFAANDGAHGVQLWESNGTAAGTLMVQDINPGGDSRPRFLTNVIGTLFFSANDGTHGAELWESNGTAAGTFLVADINPGGNGSYPFDLANVNGSLFFSANDGSRGTELWESVTVGGTFLVKDINSGPGDSRPYYLTNVSGTLFFSANDGTHGVELWEANGTFAGTFMVQDINPGPGDSIPYDLTNVNGSLLFSANDGIHGFEPWIMPVNTVAATAISSSPNPSVFGQLVTFTATVDAAPGLAAPSGTVDFKEGVTDLTPGGVGLADNQATFTTAALAVGSHTITAVYNGDSNFLGSSASSTQVVSKDTTSTALTSSPNFSVFGQGVVFTATVRALAPSGGLPSGTVHFKEGASDLTPDGITLSGGRATFITAALAVGHHTITALYTGTANFTSSQANDSAAPQVVTQAPSRTVFTSFPDPSVFGQVVSFTVAVSALPPGKGAPTGMVTFTDGTATIGSVPLNSAGRATFTTASLSRGNHAINASYAGNGSFLASNYLNFGEAVQKDATTTIVTPSANPAVVGHAVTFTATVQASAPGSGKATGSVTFKDITTMLGTGTLNGFGQATFSTSALAVGTHAITATYGGDNNFTTSVSAIIAEVVNASATARAVAAAAHASVVNDALTPPRASLTPANVTRRRLLWPGD